MADWTVVVPVKGTPSAKSRLDASPELALAIALDTVAASVAALESAGGRVIVVTSAAVTAQFEALGARVVLDGERSLNAAVAQGIEAAGVGPVAVLLGDIPALQPEELGVALSLAEHHPLAFVPDADNFGTVLIAALSAASHRPAFGGASRAAHRAAGYVELGIPLASGLRRDVDTREQLTALAGRLGHHTSDLLTESTIGAGVLTRNGDS